MHGPTVQLHDPPILAIDMRGSGLRDPGFSTPWREFPSLLIEFSSGGSWTLDIAGESSRVVPPGHILLVPSGTRHRLRVVSGPSLRSWWMLIRVERPAGLSAFAGLALPRVLPAADSAAVTKLARALIDAPLTAVPAQLMRFQAKAFALSERIFARAVPVIGSESDPRIEPVLVWIEKNLHHHVSLPELARVAGLSPSRLHDLFTKATGSSPIDWTIRTRVRRAQRLLLAEPRPTLTDVARACGFATSYYLCRIFKRVTGATPLAWRAASIARD